jgi:hypothetical protein
MHTFTVTYTCRFQLSFAPNYKWSECGRCFNSKTGRMIKQVYRGGSIGYIINGKFRTLKYLRSKLETIKEDDPLPF